MQQKPEGEKYSRVTITLPPGLYQEAKSRCNDTGLSLSTVIGDLLNVWMKEELPTPIHTDIHQCTQGDNERLTYLEEQVRAISDKIESPIHTDTYQYAQDITDIRARLEALEQVPLIATKAKENLITHTGNGYEGCQKSDKQEIDTKKELAKVAGVSHDTIAPDRVTLTDEMKRRLAEKVKGALDAGSKYADISKSTGVSVSQLKKMKSGPLGKDLRKSEYDAVMSLPSQNSSHQGT